LASKSGLLTVLLGVALMGAAPFLGVNHAKPVRVLLKDCIAVDFGEVSVLSFRVDSVRAGYLVRVYVNVTDVVVGAKTFRPILDIIMVDQEGLDLLELNQTASYIYVKALGVQDPILLTTNEMRRPGEYYVVLTNRFPVKANVPIIITDEWDEWNVNMLLPVLLVTGATLAVLGMFWNRVARHVRGLRS